MTAMEEESPLHSMFLRFLIVVCSPAVAGELLYPVAVDEPRSLVYLIYQKNPSHIELWGWNPTTCFAQQLLFSRITPAGLRLLPDGMSFSMIDQGQLKVKQLLKRSPRTVAFDAPLYNVELVHWIDATACYTHAKYLDHFGLFHITITGEVSPLCMAHRADCLYPQKVDNTLFYIERNERWQYRIAQTQYRIPPIELDQFSERRAWYEAQEQQVQTVLDFEFRPIIFLRMVSEREGFVIEHDRAMSRRDQFVDFSYHRIIRCEAEWKADKLFEFRIPSRFLFFGKEDRFYEAFLPLVPRQVGDAIFYATALGHSLELWRYRLMNGKKEQLCAASDQSFFAPVPFRKQLLTGGSLGEKIRMEPHDGGVQVNLVEIPQN